MISTRKVVLCFNGTFATKNDDQPDLIGSALAYFFMCHPNNTIAKIFNKCEEENKFHFDGPGTDLCSDKSPGFSIGKMLGTIGGFIDGHIGMHGIKNNLAEAKKILIEEGNKAKLENKKLEIHIFSWSRGGFTAWRLKKELSILISEKKLDVESLSLVNIDPVSGGPFDRMRLYWHGKEKEPVIDIDVKSVSYYSHSGNLNFWPSTYFNTIFFSALEVDDQRPSQKWLVEKWMVNATHEGIVGRSGHEADPNHPEKLAGTTVLWHIIKNSPLKFNNDWKEKILKEGERALNELAQQNLPSQQNRKFLSPGTIKAAFIGEAKNDIPIITTLATPQSEKQQDNDIKTRGEGESENLFKPNFP